jgi:FSR family fosmidomycin resistance protein-like MFS transporter
VLGLVADHTSIDFVYHLIAYLPLLGVVAVLLPNIAGPVPIARAAPAR